MVQITMILLKLGGIPLGLKFDLQGNLIVESAYEGLLSIDTTGEVTILSTECDSLPFLLTDDLDISSDGIIYFSDASSVNNLANNGDDWGEPNGRLLAYDPQTNETSLLLDGLYFANGVALAPDESYVLVNESSLGVFVLIGWLGQIQEKQKYFPIYMVILVGMDGSYPIT